MESMRGRHVTRATLNLRLTRTVAAEYIVALRRLYRVIGRQNVLLDVVAEENGILR